MAQLSATIRITRVISDDELGSQLVGPVDSLTSAMTKRAKRLAPKRSFRLEDSIERIPAKQIGAKVKGGVRVGGKVVRGKYVGYHLLVERGTSKMRAQPYMRPALLQTRSSDLKARIET